MAWFRCGGESGKTSFVWRAGGLSASLNFKRMGKTVKLKAIGCNATTAKTVVINVYGTVADNLVPYHVGTNVTLIQQVTVNSADTEVEIDVSGYDRFILYCVYGGGTVGTGGDAVYVQIEN